MNPILTVLEIVAPVFLLATVGFVWVKLGFDYQIQFVTRLTMTFSLPCLVFSSLQNATINAQVISAVSLAAVVSYAALTVGTLIILAIMKADFRTFLAPMIFGNTGNLGLPLAYFAFGDEGLSLAVVIFAIMAIYSFTAGLWMVSGGRSPLTAFSEPIFFATLLGGIFLWFDWSTPKFLTNTLELAGQMAIPMMLITLGVAVARLKPSRMGFSTVMSLAKLALSLAIAWMVGTWLDLPPIAFGVLVLQITTPVAVTSYLIAEKYGADADSVAGLVVVSTLVSVIALPVILAFVI